MSPTSAAVPRRPASSDPFWFGDARSLTKADRSFNAIRAERTLQWLPEPGSVVAELIRVLRSGGRLSLMETGWSTLHLDVGDPQITSMVNDGAERRAKPSVRPTSGVDSPNSQVLPEVR